MFRVRRTGARHVSGVSYLSNVTAALLGRSAYQRPAYEPPPVDDGPWAGQTQLPSYTRSRWYAADIETAEHAADSGDLALAGQLTAACRRDGILSGVLATRTSGLVRLPRRFRGDLEVSRALDIGRDSVRSVFDEMMPPSELALLAADGIMLGVGLGEFLDVPGRDYPVLVRLDPQYLQYRWMENRWYYRAATGTLPITPGNGRWMLHTPGGRIAPWQHAAWRALARAFVRKDHALMMKDAWEAKLANPARVAYAPQAATDGQREDYFRRVLAWGLNSVFGLTPGYEIKLLESNGRGADSFVKTIEAANTEIIVTLAGQTVTTDGGAGFSNAQIHETIHTDLIKSTADDLAYTANTQGIPVFVARRWGVDAIRTRPCVVEYDVMPPQDRNAAAQAMVTTAAAMSGIDTALANTEHALDVQKICEQYGIPLVPRTAPAAVAAPAPAPIRKAA